MQQVDKPDTQKQDSIAVLYEHYAPQLLTYLRQYNISKEDAEDLLVDVFMAAMESSTLLKLHEGAQRAWLQRVAHNKYVDYMRRITRRRTVTLDEVTESLLDVEDLAPEQVALRHEDQAQLRTHLAQLPGPQQEVLRLRFAYNLHSPEIGRRLNKSDTAVRMLLSRAINLLRKAYSLQKGENNGE